MDHVSQGGPPTTARTLPWRARSIQRPSFAVEVVQDGLNAYAESPPGTQRPSGKAARAFESEHRQRAANEEKERNENAAGWW